MSKPNELQSWAETDFMKWPQSAEGGLKNLPGIDFTESKLCRLISKQRWSQPKNPMMSVVLAEECAELTIPLAVANGSVCYGCGYQIKEKFMMKVGKS